MADATFDISYDYGGTDNNPVTTSETVTNLRFRAADNNTQDTSDPTVILASGTTFSYWKQIYLECTANDSAHTMNNLKLYRTTGAWTGDAGVTINVGDAYPLHSSVVETGYDVANVITTMASGGHTDITTVTDVFSLTSGSPASPTISEGTGEIDAVGETSNYIVLQAAVADTALAGTTPATPDSLTIQYDEAP